MTFPAPIFAANDIDALIKIGIGVVFGIGWLIKYIATKNQPQAAPPVRRPPRPAAPRDEKIKNEIEVFLQEVTGRKGQQKPRDREVARDVVVVEEPPRKKPVAPARPAAMSTQSAGRPTARAPMPAEKQALEMQGESASIRPGGAISGRKGPGSDDLGATMTSHLSQYMDATRIEKHVQQDLKHAVDDAVRAHLGKFTAESGGKPAADSGARSDGVPHAIVRLLRNPQGVRQAILIKEVLERPAARGRRRRR